MTIIPFSQRNGYKSISQLIIRESITEEIRNAILNCYVIFTTKLIELSRAYSYPDWEKELECYIWIKFLNNRLEDFYTYNGHKLAFRSVLNNNEIEWYRILDAIEFVILQVLYLIQQNPHNNKSLKSELNCFIANLNIEFTRLNYGYRIVNYQVVPITSEEEVSAIETAIKMSKNNIKDHLSKSLEHYSKRPDPDYSNSIKESISAVEAVCRNIANAKDLRGAINHLESKGIMIHNQFKQSLLSLYNYTNDSDTGIRHALLDETGAYKPTQAEAYYMLVTCSAFVNYLRMKRV